MKTENINKPCVNPLSKSGFINRLVRCAIPYWLGFLIGQIVLYPFGLSNIISFLSMCIAVCCVIFTDLLKQSNAKAEQSE
jgi:hypothetical protein